MQTGRLILLLLLVLVVVVMVLFVLRRSAGKKERSGSRPPVCAPTPTDLACQVAGQTIFAEQAAERAEVARVEAEHRPVRRRGSRRRRPSSERRPSPPARLRGDDAAGRRHRPRRHGVLLRPTVDDREEAVDDGDRHLGDAVPDDARPASEEETADARRRAGRPRGRAGPWSNTESAPGAGPRSPRRPVPRRPVPRRLVRTAAGAAAWAARSDDETGHGERAHRLGRRLPRRRARRARARRRHATRTATTFTVGRHG